jgi:hypothetical protein
MQGELLALVKPTCKVKGQSSKFLVELALIMVWSSVLRALLQVLANREREFKSVNAKDALTLK